MKLYLATAVALCVCFAIPSAASAATLVGDIILLPTPVGSPVYPDTLGVDGGFDATSVHTRWNPGDAGPPKIEATDGSTFDSISDMHAGATNASVSASAGCGAIDACRSGASIVDKLTISQAATVTIVGTVNGHSDESESHADVSVILVNDAQCVQTPDGTDCPAYGYDVRGITLTSLSDSFSVPASLSAGTYSVIAVVRANATNGTAAAAATFHIEVPTNVAASSQSGLLPIQGGAPSGNTPTGSNVSVSPVDSASGTTADVTFDTVTSAGNTTLTSSANAPALPSGFQLAGSVYYDLSTTATWSGSATICFPYSGAIPHLLHFDTGAGTWIDVTDQSLSTAFKVCGRVASFSPFATAVVSPTVTATTPADGATGVAANVSPTATFSAPMDATTITNSTFTLAGPGGAVPATVSYNSAANTATLTPAVSLPPGTTYTSTLAAAIKGANGASLAGPVSWSFTTAAPADTVPPTLNLPSPITKPATSPIGAFVTYSVTATDDVDANPSVSCAPASGSQFAIGVTTVNCTATDSSGNKSNGSFTVTVTGAKEQLNALSQKVVNYTALPTTTKTQLIGSLQTLVANFDPSNATQRQLVCGALKLFIAAVQSMSGKTLPTSVAVDWISDATRIRAVLACS